MFKDPQIVRGCLLGVLSITVEFRTPSAFVFLRRCAPLSEQEFHYSEKIMTNGPAQLTEPD